ncbi:MAG: hypothetical protein J2P48_08315 [Alphaproteobacteria bacterium]|nr:hypothetical protein [Alphaproteobacteria bacterium]
MIGTILTAIRQPSIAACVAALLTAVGVEVQSPAWEHGIEIIAAIIALIGIFLGISTDKS